jgi:hypothetical protein
MSDGLDETTRIDFGPHQLRGQERRLVREFIHRRFLVNEPAETLRDTTPLQTSAIIDSLGMLELGEFLFDHFGARPSSADHLDTVDDIMRWLAWRSPAAAKEP